MAVATLEPGSGRRSDRGAVPGEGARQPGRASRYPVRHRDAGRGGARHGSATGAAPGGERATARAAGGRRVGHRRAEPGHGQAPADDRARGAARYLGADPGRKRNRQGTGGARAAAAKPAGRQTLHRDQLRGAHGNAARKRAIRTRERRVHRRGGAEEGQAGTGRRAARSSSTRSANSRRRCRPSCCACCSSASSSAWAARALTSWTSG